LKCSFQFAINISCSDGSGIGEMQQLLNKFNSIRERKSSVDLIDADPVIPAEKPPLVSLATAKTPVAPVVAPTTNGTGFSVFLIRVDFPNKRPWVFIPMKVYLRSQQ
jgi:hypothetical protein